MALRSFGEGERSSLCSCSVAFCIERTRLPEVYESDALVELKSERGSDPLHPGG